MNMFPGLQWKRFAGLKAECAVCYFMEKLRGVLYDLVNEKGRPEPDSVCLFRRFRYFQCGQKNLYNSGQYSYHLVYKIFRFRYSRGVQPQLLQKYLEK